MRMFTASNPIVKVLSLMLLGVVCVPAALQAQAIPVEIRDDNGVFQLMRGGEPYWVRGAGGEDELELLARIGGNSIRTWGGDPGKVLDRAHALGLTVTVGLWIEHQRHGFDYDDAAAVERQFAVHQAVIDAHKDHPALLMWGIGNEVELESTNPKVWDLIERVAAYAREVDPHHPTMTVTAHIIPEVVGHIRTRAPSIQVLGINTYAGIGVVADVVEETWKGPYLITEWGPNGQWEADVTDWGAEIEPTSSEKAMQRALRHGLIAGDRERCLGGYAFKWGYKQEVTPTWYGFFTESGAVTESVEMLSYAWRGKWPQLRAPRILSVALNGAPATSSVTIAPGKEGLLEVVFDGDSVQPVEAVWYILHESTDKRIGGDAEKKPDQVPVQFLSTTAASARFVTPDAPGNYRIFGYFYTADRSTVATANFPFRVEESD